MIEFLSFVVVFLLLAVIFFSRLCERKSEESLLLAEKLKVTTEALGDLSEEWQKEKDLNRRLEYHLEELDPDLLHEISVEENVVQ